MHKECLEKQDNRTLLMLFNTTQPSYVPPEGHDISYWAGGSEHFLKMPKITICNLQDELDKVRDLEFDSAF
jgi:hypothetical protein